MAKPNVLCKLFKGKLIDTFVGFVDTFNYLVDFVENLKGDGDTDKSKNIVVDRSVPDRPVIKFNGSGGSSDLEVITDLEFAIEDGFLQLKLTKAKIKGVTYESITYDSTVHRRPAVGAITGKNVVTKTHYNEDGDHVFKQNVIEDVLVIYPKDASTIPAEDTESVFLTTLHA